MKLLSSTHLPARLGALLSVAAVLAGCTVVGDGILAGDKVDYRGTAVKAQPLEVPPDLTQLARESRYQTQGGVVSAAAAAGPAPAAAAAAAPAATVALNSLGSMRVERQAQQRWLVVPQTPEQLWPQLKAFWADRGFTLTEDNAQAGVMETNWAENRAKLTGEVTRNVIGRLLGTLYDTGERDRFRTRVERTAGGSEVYVTHRGVEEVYAGERRESTVWRGRPNDPQLEAEMLARLMVALGASAEPARAAIAAAAPAAAGSAPASAATPAPSAAGPAGGPARASAQGSTLVVNEPFDRAWRRVGLALDRTGFTVEDRDRAAGLYYVRYVDPKNAGKEEPGWWAQLWGDKSNPQEALRYRVVVKGSAERSTVAVQNATGSEEAGDNAQRILGLLLAELR